MRLPILILVLLSTLNLFGFDLTVQNDTTARVDFYIYGAQDLLDSFGVDPGISGIIAIPDGAQWLNAGDGTDGNQTAFPADLGYDYAVTYAGPSAWSSFSGGPAPGGVASIVTGASGLFLSVAGLCLLIGLFFVGHRIVKRIR